MTTINKNKEEYELINNTEFLDWLNALAENGYELNVTVDNLQLLIDTIASWYELKYPDDLLTSKKKISTLTKNKNAHLLLTTLIPLDKESIINPIYKGELWQIRMNVFRKDVEHIRENGQAKSCSAKYIDDLKKPHSDLIIYRKEHFPTLMPDYLNFFVIQVNCFTGEVNLNSELREYIDDKDEINIYDALSILKNKYKDRLNLVPLERCIYNHDCDLKLRREILYCAATKLLNSKNTTPGLAYERAKIFVSDFNKALRMDLSFEDLNIENSSVRLDSFRK